VEVIVKLLFGLIAPSFTFLISSAGTQFQGNPFFGGGGKNTRAMGKFCDFRLKSPSLLLQLNSS